MTMKEWVENNNRRIKRVKVPENHIVIDFDVKGKDGIHLHYIYDGDRQMIKGD